MNIDELMIGNYINGIFEHEIDRGNGIIEDVESSEIVRVAVLDSVGISDYKIWVDEGTMEAYDRFEPIWLTQEWIIDFGAEEWSSWMVMGRFRFIYKEGLNFWYVVDNVDLTYMTKIEYVHELQNFYFIMNGKKLEI